ncbi:TetR family transcriptional regulator [Roseiarcus fermentans]|uniref:TetR family transcriptional regulator n=1 Tax=Roseiarcus fermentans TaxID=1473586 RepID=A0A366F7F9_9HYPH|nr:TetR/AcrR family transcriptional regulator [Roseiarcus fermentans]RBP10578.1 TetR family transcriptional regulator [Roseiarcus fermentans]
MSPVPFPGRRPAEDNRRERIIEAAERAFVRHGFHAATMSHVAEEAAMSAGNLYRYFPSKEAIVEALCALDQEGAGDSFATLLAQGCDLRKAAYEALRDQVLGKPREKVRMIVEIWAEAGRNPRVAEMTRALDVAVLGKLERLFEAAKATGVAAPALGPRFAARFFLTFVGGLFKRMATEPEFDRSAEAAMAYGVLNALFAGAIAPGGEDGSQ